MCVDQVKTLYNCLRTIIKHFESSIKNKEPLDQCMGFLQMTTIHLISWCGTRIAHFLEACLVFNKLLVPIHDTLFSLNIRKEERDILFTAENIYTLQVMCDLHHSFHDKYLWQVDKSTQLVSTVYKIAQDIANGMPELATPAAEKFLESLDIDENNNMTVNIELNGNKHCFLLNKHCKTSRHRSKNEILECIKEELISLKDEILGNIKANIKDQCGEETHFYSWSGLNLEDQDMSCDDRIHQLRDLITLFCVDKIHPVFKYSNKKETQATADMWKDYKVRMISY